MGSSFYISFAVWIAIIPFLGIPGEWKNWLVLGSGIFLLLISLGPILLNRLQVKTKPKRKSSKTISATPTNPPVNSEDNNSETSSETKKAEEKNEF